MSRPSITRRPVLSMETRGGVVFMLLHRDADGVVFMLGSYTYILPSMREWRGGGGYPPHPHMARRSRAFPPQPFLPQGARESTRSPLSRVQGEGSGVRARYAGVPV